MKYTEWVNYWIQNPECCTFVVCILEDGTKVYIINYKDYYTGRVENLTRFSVEKESCYVIDCRSDKILGTTKDILLEKFEELALNKEQELLDKGEGNIEDEA